jgi:hypothetical protein
MLNPEAAANMLKLRRCCIPRIHAQSGAKRLLALDYREEQALQHRVPRDARPARARPASAGCRPCSSRRSSILSSGR